MDVQRLAQLLPHECQEEFLYDKNVSYEVARKVMRREPDFYALVTHAGTTLRSDYVNRLATVLLLCRATGVELDYPKPSAFLFTLARAFGWQTTTPVTKVVAVLRSLLPATSASDGTLLHKLMSAYLKAGGDDMNFCATLAQAVNSDDDDLKRVYAREYEQRYGVHGNPLEAYLFQ